MKKYYIPCEEGHELEKITVEANSEEEAKTKLVNELQKHNELRHPDMNNMSDKDVKSFVDSHIMTA